MRPFAASATGFAHRYRRDIFYRTGWNVLALQIGFAAVLVVLTFASLSFLYDEIIESLIAAIAQTLATGASPADGSMIAASLEYEKQKSIVLTTSAVLVAAAIFSWLITAIALRPTRVALESQKQFVGNIAHELRTPLAILKTDTEVALFNERLDKGTRETFTSNLEELDRISEIINNLLSMNALIAPGKVAFANTELAPILERVTRTLAELASHKRITVSTSLGGFDNVWGNAAALEQIATNIVRNAINYTPLGGTVEIETRPDYKGHVELEVRDTGVGIPEKDLERVFEPFYRGDRSRNRAGGAGSGLGLAIVGEIVRSHKGSVRIQSAEGKGTTVTVTLPAGRSLPPPLPEAKKEEDPSVRLS